MSEYVIIKLLSSMRIVFRVVDYRIGDIYRVVIDPVHGHVNVFVRFVSCS